MNTADDEEYREAFLQLRHEKERLEARQHELEELAAETLDSQNEQKSRIARLEKQLREQERMRSMKDEVNRGSFSHSLSFTRPSLCFSFLSPSPTSLTHI